MELTLIEGNLVRDPELRTTSNGKNVCNFTLAVNRKTPNGEDKPTYYEVVVWNMLGEECAKELHKGQRVLVRGESNINVYTGRDGAPKGTVRVTANIVAKVITFRKSDASNDQKTASDAFGGKPVDPASMEDIPLADIPF